jgi:hypothetical protein
MYLTLFAPLSLAQGICDYIVFRVETIKGRVVSNGPNGYEPIPQAKVELWHTGGADKDDTLIASTLSGDNGYFEINNIKKGLYRLHVSTSLRGFFDNFAGVKIVKKVKDSEKGKLIVFRLGVEVLKPCGGGDIFLQ